MKMRFGMGVLAYLPPTFALGFVWHLMVFHGYSQRLAIYRQDIIISFVFLSMLIQAFLFAWIYRYAFTQRSGGLLLRGFSYAAFGAALSWSFTTLVVTAKNVMTSGPDYLIIETAFTAVHWIMVGPHRGSFCRCAAESNGHRMTFDGCRSHLREIWSDQAFQRLNRTRGLPKFAEVV